MTLLSLCLFTSCGGVGERGKLPSLTHQHSAPEISDRMLPPIPALDSIDEHADACSDHIPLTSPEERIYDLVEGYQLSSPLYDSLSNVRPQASEVACSPLLSEDTDVGSQGANCTSRASQHSDESGDTTVLYGDHIRPNVSSSEDSVPTLVQCLSMARSEDVLDDEEREELDGPAEEVYEERKSSVTRDSSSGKDVSPYAIFDTQPGYLPSSPTSNTSEYAEPSRLGVSPRKASGSDPDYAEAKDIGPNKRGSKVYINPNSPSPEAMENFKTSDDQLIELNKSVDHTYISFTEGRQPEPLPRPDIKPPSASVRDILNQQKNKAPAVNEPETYGDVGASLAAFALHAAVMPSTASAGGTGSKGAANATIASSVSPVTPRKKTSASLSVPLQGGRERARSLNDIDAAMADIPTAPVQTVPETYGNITARKPGKGKAGKEKPARPPRPDKNATQRPPANALTQQQTMARLATMAAGKVRNKAKI